MTRSKPLAQGVSTTRYKQVMDFDENVELGEGWCYSRIQQTNFFAFNIAHYQYLRSGIASEVFYIKSRTYLNPMRHPIGLCHSEAGCPGFRIDIKGIDVRVCQ